VAVAEDMPEELVDLLARNLRVPEAIVYRTKHLRDLRRLGELSRVDRPDLKYAPVAPPLPMALRSVHGYDIFSAIRARDILVHHPFESFQPVVDFVRQSAVDPSVLAISMTLYRVDRDSPIVSSLIEAARAGKRVRVVVELRARFDETNNITWARALERAGAHVTYGMPDLKVHAKIAMVARREGEKVRTYVHVSSGKYTPGTACAYTDDGLLTCDEDVARDAIGVFNFLTGHAAPSAFRKLVAAPATLKQRVTELIGNEIAHRQAGRPGRIILKMNALSDPGIIGLLYLASQHGVEIDLIIRGICCLRPGIHGVSDNIRVRSIVGRFLEHSRIWYFNNGGQERVFIGSADLMPRNFERRVEVMIPVEEGAVRRRIRDEILAAYLADDVKAWTLRSDGGYERAPAGGAGGASQDALLNRL
jgi:polyphosphate kinase